MHQRRTISRRRRSNKQLFYSRLKNHNNTHSKKRRSHQNIYLPSDPQSSIQQIYQQIFNPSIPFKLLIPYSSSPTISIPDKKDIRKTHDVLNYMIYRKTFTNVCNGPSLYWSFDNDDFDDLQFDVLISFIIYCPHDVVVFRYILSAKEWNGITHANMVVVNKKSKIWEIEHFEPHGVVTDDLVMQRILNASDAALKDKFTLNKAGIQFRYLSPIDVCPYAGPQSRSMNYYSDVGLCAFWVTWYAIVRIINSDKTAEFIQNAIFNLHPIVLQNLIQDFVSYIHQYSIDPMFIKMSKEIQFTQLLAHDLAELLYNNDNTEKLYRFMMSIIRIIGHNPNSLDTMKNINLFMDKIKTIINNHIALDETVQNKILTLFESMDGKNIKDPLLKIPINLYNPYIFSKNDILYNPNIITKEDILYKYLDDVEDSIKKLPDIDQNSFL